MSYRFVLMKFKSSKKSKKNIGFWNSFSQFKIYKLIKGYRIQEFVYAIKYKIHENPKWKNKA